MPSVKRAGVKAQEVKTGFEAYDGPEPTKRGQYRARVVAFKYKQFSSGSTGLVISLVLEAQKGDPKDHAKFDGFPITTNVVFGDKEAMIARESNLYAALGVGNEPNIVYEAGEPTDGLKVTKIGGKNPINAVVNADIKQGTYQGDARPEVDGIYKYRDLDTTGGSSDDEDDEAEDEEYDDSDAEVEETDEDSEDDAEEDDEEDAEDDSAEYDEREAELKKLAVPKLKAIAKGLGVPVGGSKDDLVERILAEEFTDEEDEDAEEDDEIDEEAEDEEDEDDERAAREEELSELDRAALKSALKAANPEARILKSHSDDDLRAMVLEAEFPSDDTPF